MKKYTIDELKSICCTDRATFRDIINAAKARRQTLIETFEETRNATPDETVTALIEKLGHTEAREAICELIAQTSEHDGRISWQSREYGDDTALPVEWLRDSYMPIDCIHPAHRDQIALAAIEQLPTWEQAKAADIAAAVAGVEIDEAMEEIIVAEVQEELDTIAAEQEARRAELADVPEWVHDPDQYNGRYDYREAVTACALSAIIDDGYITKDGHTVDDLTREELENRVHDDLWIDDAVTGNASGSFYCSAWRAESAIAHNWELIGVMSQDWDLQDVVKRGAECIDVMLRCYLLSGCISDALDRLEAENLISYGD